MNETKISSGTIVRTVCLLLALVNQILSASGHAILPIEDAQVETIVTTVLTVVTSLVAWWKNQSFTKEACAADDYMHNLKEKNKDKVH